MASGLACIVSDKAGIAALLADREEAIIFPGGDERALAAAISGVLRDPTLQDRLRREGRRKALAFFSTRRMVDEMEALLLASVRRGISKTKPLSQPAPNRGDWRQNTGGRSRSSHDASIQ
jgi:glycosyltransferase involved in cell wall biosynthesis